MPELTLTEADRKLTREKRESALKRAKEACEYLLGLGAREAYIFGSVLDPEKFHLHSDVDIAVAGLPDEYIYRVEWKVEDILGGMDFDLVYMEYARDYILKRIKKEGVRYARNVS